MKSSTQPIKETIAKFNRMIRVFNLFLVVLIFLAISQKVHAQATPAKIDVPDWALPGSATHTQVPPPADFHRVSRTDKIPIGIFEGQTDVGAALVPGSSGYNVATNQYTITSAGYNVWYTRDEFRYVWKKMSGDISLAADISFPDTTGYDDRKAFVIIRQSLDDDSKEAVVALHGGGLLHLAWRPGKGESMKEMRVNRRKGIPDPKGPDGLALPNAKRIGIEKHGDSFAVFISMHGEPMHQFGDPITLHIDGSFYAGIGFCSHLPATPDTAVLSNVVLENAAGKVR